MLVYRSPSLEPVQSCRRRGLFLRTSVGNDAVPTCRPVVGERTRTRLSTSSSDATSIHVHAILPTKCGVDRRQQHVRSVFTEFDTFTRRQRTTVQRTLGVTLLVRNAARYYTQTRISFCSRRVLSFPLVSLRLAVPPPLKLRPQKKN